METIGKGPAEKKENGEKTSKIHLLFGLLIGIVIALVLGLLLKVRPIFSILAGLGGFIAGILIFKPQPKKNDFSIFDQIDGITPEMHQKALKEGQEKLSKLRAYSGKIKDSSVKSKADGICTVTEKILESIKQDPKDLKPARSFLNYYLDTAMNILKRYNEITVQQVQSKDVKEVIAKVDRTLGTLEKAFEKQHAKLMENDVMDLDTELTVLERTIEMEGFGRDSSE